MEDVKWLLLLILLVLLYMSGLLVWIIGGIAALAALFGIINAYFMIKERLRKK